MKIANLLDLKSGVKLPIEEASQKVHKNTLSLASNQNKDICVSSYGMIFDDIDTNNDGGILLDELTGFLSKALAALPDIMDIKVASIAQKYFEELDADKGGAISREEFLRAGDLMCGMKEAEIANS